MFRVVFLGINYKALEIENDALVLPSVPTYTPLTYKT